MKDHCWNGPKKEKVWRQYDVVQQFFMLFGMFNIFDIENIHKYSFMVIIITTTSNKEKYGNILV